MLTLVKFEIYDSAKKFVKYEAFPVITVPKIGETVDIFGSIGVVHDVLHHYRRAEHGQVTIATDVIVFLN